VCPPTDATTSLCVMSLVMGFVAFSGVGK